MPNDVTSNVIYNLRTRIISVVKALKKTKVT